jgi:hypothetical protein
MTTDIRTPARGQQAGRALRRGGGPDSMEKTADRRRADPAGPRRDGATREADGRAASIRRDPACGTPRQQSLPLTRPVLRQRTRPAPPAGVPRRAVPPAATPGAPTGGTAGVQRPRPAAGLRGSSPRDKNALGVPRMPFVLLVLALLGGGLICLLVINTTLGAASFRISQLQKAGATLSTQEQSLREQVATERAPAEIAKRAYQLGMRVQASTHIVDLRTHQTYVLPGQLGVDADLGASPAAGVSPASAASPAPTPTAAGSPAATPPPGGQPATAARSGQ